MSLSSALSVNLNRLRLDQLQAAVRSNEVSFPSQVPIFVKHSQGRRQCHVVLLYFVHGWSCDRIAQRYDVTRQHVWQMVSEWRRHAVELGYMQVIPPLETHPAQTQPAAPAWTGQFVLPSIAGTAEALSVTR